MISLERSLVLETPDADSAVGRDAPPHSFVLVTPLRQYVLAAENDEDRRAWVAALDAACSAGRPDTAAADADADADADAAADADAD